MLQKSSTFKVMEVFFVNPTTDFCLRDISKLTKLAHTSVKNNLQKLIRLDFIQRRLDKKGRRIFPIYKANRNSKQFIKYKQISNIASLIESKIVNHIEKDLFPKSIVLFGSFHRGEDIEDSDIDLFIESKEKNIDLISFEKRFNRKIQLHFNEKFTSYPKELKNNIINGLVIHGFLEGYK